MALDHGRGRDQPSENKKTRLAGARVQLRSRRDALTRNATPHSILPVIARRVRAHKDDARCAHIRTHVVRAFTHVLCTHSHVCTRSFAPVRACPHANAHARTTEERRGICKGTTSKQVFVLFLRERERERERERV